MVGEHHFLFLFTEAGSLGSNGTYTGWRICLRTLVELTKI